MNNKDELQNIMRGDEDKISRTRFSYIVLAIVGVVIVVVLAITIWKSIEQPISPEKMATNREDFIATYDRELAKSTSSTVKFQPSKFDGNTFIIGVEINKASFTQRDVVNPKWLADNGQINNAKAMCKEAVNRIINNRYIGAQMVEYRYYYDQTMQYAIRITGDNCKDYL